MKAHDVRHMCFCDGCRTFADDRTAIRLKGEHFEKLFPDQYDLDSYWHPGCFVKTFGESVVFCLARDEREKFRLCDVSAKTMRELLKT